MEWVLARGGDGVRTGLEDSIRISKDRLASGNAELVKRAVDAISRHNARPATPQEARVPSISIWSTVIVPISAPPGAHKCMAGRFAPEAAGRECPLKRARRATDRSWTSLAVVSRQEIPLFSFWQLAIHRKVG